MSQDPSTLPPVNLYDDIIGSSPASALPKDPNQGIKSSNRFGAQRPGHIHAGTDFGGALDSDVGAADDGDVIFAGPDGNKMGNAVKIRHSDGTVSVYGHLNKVGTSVGAKVSRGDSIGLLGQTGNAKGPHVHFEVRPGGSTAVDPMSTSYRPLIGALALKARQERQSNAYDDIIGAPSADTAYNDIVSDAKPLVQPTSLTSRQQAQQNIANGSAAPPTSLAPVDNYTTRLNPDEEGQFHQWKQQYAPNDSGADYDLRGAFKAGLKPDPQTGHWPDTFKKPNHPTFSNESQYAVGADAAKAGSWSGDTFVPPGSTQPEGPDFSSAINAANAHLAAVAEGRANRDLVDKVYGYGIYDALPPEKRAGTVQNAKYEAQYRGTNTQAEQLMTRQSQIEAAQRRQAQARRAQAQAVMARKNAQQQNAFADVLAGAGGDGSVLPQVGGPPSMSGITPQSTARIAQQTQRTARTAPARAIIAQEAMRQGPGLPSIGDRVSDRLQSEGITSRPLTDPEKQQISAQELGDQLNQTHVSSEERDAIRQRVRSELIRNYPAFDTANQATKRSFESEVDNMTDGEVRQKEFERELGQMSPQDQREIQKMRDGFIQDSKLYRWADVGKQDFMQLAPNMASSIAHIAADLTGSSDVRSLALEMGKTVNKRMIASELAKADMSTPEKAATSSLEFLGNIFNIVGGSAAVGPVAAMGGEGFANALGRTGSYGEGIKRGGVGAGLGSIAKVMPFLEPYPGAKLLYQKAANIGTDATAFGVGTYTLERAMGTPHPEALKAALTNAAAIGVMRMTQIIPNIANPVARGIVRSPYVPETARNIVNNLAGAEGFRQPAVVTEFDTPDGANEALTKYGERPVVPKRALSVYRNPDTDELVTHEIDLETAKKYHEASPNHPDLVTVDGKPYTRSGAGLTEGDAARLREGGDNPNEWDRVYDPDGKPILVRQADIVIPRKSYAVTPEDFEWFKNGAKGEPPSAAKQLAAPTPMLPETAGPRVAPIVPRTAEGLSAPERAQESRVAEERAPEAEDLTAKEKESALRALTGATKAGDTESAHRLGALAKARGATPDELLNATKAASVVTPPTAETPRVPERPETVQSQLEALTEGRGSRKAVIIPDGQDLPAVPAGLEAHVADNGDTFIYDPKKTSPEAIDRAVETGTTNKLIGAVEPEGPKTDTVVVARAPDGTESQAVYVSPDKAPAQVAEFQAQHPDSSIEVGGKPLEDKVLKDRRSPDRLSDAEYKAEIADSLKRKNERVAKESDDDVLKQVRPAVRDAYRQAYNEAQSPEEREGILRQAKAESSEADPHKHFEDEARKREASIPKTQQEVEDLAGKQRKLSETERAEEESRLSAEQKTRERARDEEARAARMIGPALDALHDANLAGDADAVKRHTAAAKAAGATPEQIDLAMKRAESDQRTAAEFDADEESRARQFWEDFKKRHQAKNDEWKRNGGRQQAPITDDIDARVKAAIADAKANGQSPEFRSFFAGIEPRLAGTTIAKVAAFAEGLGIPWKPQESWIAKEKESAEVAPLPAQTGLKGEPKDASDQVATPVTDLPAKVGEQVATETPKTKSLASGAGQPALPLTTWKDAKVGDHVEHEGKVVEVAGRHLRRTKADEVAARSDGNVIPEPSNKSGLQKRFAVVKATEYAAPPKSLIDEVSALVDDKGKLTRGGDYVTSLMKDRSDAEVQALHDWAEAHESPAVRRWTSGNAAAELRRREMAKEKESDAEYDYASTQVNLPPAIAKLVKAASMKIADADLTDKGREDQFHVTLKFGLADEDPEPVEDLLSGEGPITAKLKGVSIFPASESGKADVVKIDVTSRTLHRLNKKISNEVEVTDTHPAYKPHITLAYVKPGAGAKYVGMDIGDLAGMEVTFDEVAFSDKQGEQTEIPLGGEETEAEGLPLVEIKRRLPIGFDEDSVHIIDGSESGAWVEPADAEIRTLYEPTFNEEQFLNAYGGFYDQELDAGIAIPDLAFDTVQQTVKDQHARLEDIRPLAEALESGIKPGTTRNLTDNQTVEVKKDLAKQRRSYDLVYRELAEGFGDEVTDNVRKLVEGDSHVHSKRPVGVTEGSAGDETKAEVATKEKETEKEAQMGTASGEKDLADAFDDLLEQPAKQPAGKLAVATPSRGVADQISPAPPSSISEKTLSLADWSDQVKTVGSKTSVGDLRNLVEQGQRIRETVKTNTVLNSTLGLLEKMLKKKGGKVADQKPATASEKPNEIEATTPKAQQTAPDQSEEAVTPKPKRRSATVRRLTKEPSVQTASVVEAPSPTPRRSATIPRAERTNRAGFTPAQVEVIAKETKEYANALMVQAFGEEGAANFKKQWEGEFPAKMVTGNAGKPLEAEPKTIDVPDDGQFVVGTAQQANRLHQRATGKPIPGFEKESGARVTAGTPQGRNPTLGTPHLNDLIAAFGGNEERTMDVLKRTLAAADDDAPGRGDQQKLIDQLQKRWEDKRDPEEVKAPFVRQVNALIEKQHEYKELRADVIKYQTGKMRDPELKAEQKRIAEGFPPETLLTYTVHDPKSVVGKRILFNQRTIWDRTELPREYKTKSYGAIDWFRIEAEAKEGIGKFKAEEPAPRVQRVIENDADTLEEFARDNGGTTYLENAADALGWNLSRTAEALLHLEMNNRATQLAGKRLRLSAKESVPEFNVTQEKDPESGEVNYQFHVSKADFPMRIGDFAKATTPKDWSGENVIISSGYAKTPKKAKEKLLYKLDFARIDSSHPSHQAMMNARDEHEKTAAPIRRSVEKYFDSLSAAPIEAKQQIEVGDDVTVNLAGRDETVTISSIRGDLAYFDYFGTKSQPLSELALKKKSERNINRAESAKAKVKATAEQEASHEAWKAEQAKSWETATERTPAHDEEAQAAYKKARGKLAEITNEKADLRDKGQTGGKAFGEGSPRYVELNRLQEEQEEIIEAAEKYAKNPQREALPSEMTRAEWQKPLPFKEQPTLDDLKAFAAQQDRFVTERATLSEELSDARKQLQKQQGGARGKSTETRQTQRGRRQGAQADVDAIQTRIDALDKVWQQSRTGHDVEGTDYADYLSLGRPLPPERVAVYEGSSPEPKEVAAPVTAKSDYTRTTPAPGTPERAASEQARVEFDTKTKELSEQESEFKEKANRSKYGSKVKEQWEAKARKADDALSQVYKDYEAQRKQWRAENLEDVIVGGDEANRLSALAILNDDTKGLYEKVKKLGIEEAERQGAEYKEAEHASMSDAESAAISASSMIMNYPGLDRPLAKQIETELRVSQQKKRIADAHAAIESLPDLSGKSDYYRKLDQTYGVPEDIERIVDSAKEADKAARALKERAAKKKADDRELLLAKLGPANGYFIRVNEETFGEPFLPVNGTAVEIKGAEGANLFVHRRVGDPNEFSVSEATTGFSIGQGKTEQGAKRDAAKTIEEKGREKFKAAITQAVEKQGASPWSADIPVEPEKEPWQMTKKEAMSLAKQRQDMLASGMGKTLSKVARWDRNPTVRGIAEDAHKNAVLAALREGQPVPRNVLADYPALTQVAAKRAPKPSATLSDVGEKIGGARKDRWQERGLALSDLEGMSGGEESKYVTKANIWKPDYADMIEQGTTPEGAAGVKVIYDQIAAKPRKDTPEDRRRYLTMMGHVKDVLSQVKTIDDAKAASARVFDKLKWSEGGSRDPETKATLFSIYKGGHDPTRLSYGGREKAAKMVREGFPNIEPWQRRFDVQKAMAQSRDAAPYYLSKRGKYSPVEDQFFATKEEAVARAKAIYEESKTKAAEGETPSRPYLDKVERVGKDIRDGRDVTGDDFLKDFGFRGIEFGNWAASDERQRLVNHAYEALHDLAGVLNVPPKALSLNGQLGLAFGARGGGWASAHYEPSKLVINLTKLRGAGAVAHEFAHGLDHYLGELDRENAYQGAGRYLTGGHGAPVMKQAGKSNIRPDLAEAFDGVMDAMFKRDKTQAEAVRDQELQVEKGEAAIARQKASVVKAEAATDEMYGGRQRAKFIKESNEWITNRERVLLRQKEGLAKLRDEPEPEGGYGKVETSYSKEAGKLSGKSLEGYWTRPTEMFARAFESYVFDRMASEGQKSDYLVHAVEGERYAGEKYKGNPYPVGPERDAIDSAIDNLVKTLKTKETEKGTALFAKSRPTYTPPYTITALKDEKLQGRRGKEVKLETIKQILKQPGTKQAERDVINEVLELPEFKNKMSFPYDDFEGAVRESLMPLHVIDTSTYATYGESHVGVAVTNASTHIYNSELEHGQTGHFKSDYERNLGEFEVKEVTNPRNNKPIFFAVPKGVKLTEENIESQVGTAASTREQAEEWIAMRKLAGSTPNKGMFGWARIWKDNSVGTEIANAGQGAGDSYIAEIQSDPYQGYDAANLVVESYRQRSRQGTLSPSSPMYNVATDYAKAVSRIGELSVYAREYDELTRSRSVNRRELATYREELPALEKLVELGVPEELQTARDTYGDSYFRGHGIEESALVAEILKKVKAVGGRNPAFVIESVDHMLRNAAGAQVAVPSAFDLQIDHLRSAIPRAEARIAEATEKLKEFVEYEKERDLADSLKEQALKQLPIQDRQFIAHRKNWPTRILREEIRRAAGEGQRRLLLPTPRTLALIEGYISSRNDEYSDDEINMPYTIPGPAPQPGREISDLEVRDEIKIGDKDFIVIKADGEEITVTAKDNTFTYDAYDEAEARAKDYISEAKSALKPYEGKEYNVNDDGWADTLDEINKELQDGPGMGGLDLEEYDFDPDEDGNFVFSYSDVERKIEEYAGESANQDGEFDFQDFDSDYTKDLGRDGPYFVVNKGADTETFSQPEVYRERAEEAAKYAAEVEGELTQAESDPAAWVREKFTGREETVLNKYVELNALFKKERSDAERVKDKDGNYWLATALTPEDAGPVAIFARDGKEPALPYLDRIGPVPELGHVESNTVSLGPGTVGVKALRAAYEAQGQSVDGIGGVHEKNPRDLALTFSDIANDVEFPLPVRQAAESLAKAVTEAGQKNAPVVLYSSWAILAHELFHVAADVGSLTAKHADFEGLTSHPAWPRIRTALVAQGYPDSLPLLVEEAASNLAEGYTLGLTFDERVDWMTAWFQSIVKGTNGATLSRFKELSNAAEKAKANILSVYANDARTSDAAGADEGVPGTDETLRSVSPEREEGSLSSDGQEQTRLFGEEPGTRDAEGIADERTRQDGDIKADRSDERLRRARRADRGVQQGQRTGVLGQEPETGRETSARSDREVLPLQHSPVDAGTGLASRGTARNESGDRISATKDGGRSRGADVALQREPGNSAGEGGSASAVGASTPDQRTLADIEPRVIDTPEFKTWLSDLMDGNEQEIADALADDSLRQSYLDDYLNEEHSIRVREDGLIEFYRLDDAARKIIGDNPVIVYHHTSDAILPEIERDGLKRTESTHNAYENSKAGVYVTTEVSGPAVQGYQRSATSNLGGNEIILGIKTDLDSLEPDPDDADIQSGATQYVLPYVSPRDIVEITRGSKTEPFDSNSDTLMARLPEDAEDPEWEEIRQGGRDISEQVEGGFPVGIKNADTAKDRANLGLDPIIIEARKVIPTIDQAVRDFNPDRAYELVKAIGEHSRNLSGEETGQMTVYKVYLKHEYRAALNAVRQAQEADDGSEQVARIRMAILDQQMDDYHEMGRRTAYEWHFTGLMRQQMMKADYSIEEVKMRARALMGEPLSAKEEQAWADLVQERDDAIEALRVYDEQKSLEAAEQRLKDLQEQERREARNRKARASQKWRENQEKEKTRVRVVTKIVSRDALDDEFEQMSRDLDAMLTSDFGLNPFLEPRLLSQLKKMATNRVKAGADTVEDWILPVWERIKGKRMVLDAGATERDLRDALSGYGKTIQMSKEEIDIKLRELRALARDVSALEDIESGQRPARSGLQRDKQTQRQRESKKRINAALREYNIQVEQSERSPEELQQSALDAMKTRLRNRIEDLKTYIEGGERAPKRPPVQPDPEARILIAERDRLQKVLDDIEGPSKKTDAEKIALATAAVEKSIADYEKRIAEGDVLVHRKAVEPWSRELGRLKKRQTELKAQVAEDRKNHLTTKAEAAERILRGLKSSIDRIERRVAAGDLSVAPKAPPSVSTPEIEAAKAQRKALQSILAKMRRDAKPEKTDAERYASRLVALHKRLDKRESELNEMLRTGMFTKRPKPMPIRDPGIDAKRAAVKRAEDQIEMKLREIDRANRGKWQKFVGHVAGVRRAVVLSSTFVIGKLTNAATMRILLSMGEEVVGAPLPYLPIIGVVARQAPSEGRLNLKAEYKHITKAYSAEMFRQAGKVLKTGKMDIDILYGKKKEGGHPDSWYEFIGHVHGMLKTPAKIASFERYMEKNLAWLHLHGYDVTSEPIKAIAAARAVIDANRAILQQDNVVSELFKKIMSVLEAKRYPTSEDPKKRQVQKFPTAAAILRFMFPVTRVPPNFLFESINYTPLGFVIAATRLGKAIYTHGLDEASYAPGGGGAGVPPRGLPPSGNPFDRGIPPDDADAIIRGIKKATLGSPFMVLALLSALGLIHFVQFGGYYRRGKKKKEGDVPFGGVRILGFDLPSWAGHIPLFEAMQMITTAVQVFQDYRDKDKEVEESATHAALDTARGMASEIPFYEEPSRAITAMEHPEGFAQWMGDVIRGLAMPPDVQRGVRTWDPSEPTTKMQKLGEMTGFRRGQPVKRKPEGSFIHRVGQEIELGVPGARKNVPANTDANRTDLKEEFTNQVRQLKVMVGETRYQKLTLGAPGVEDPDERERQRIQTWNNLSDVQRNAWTKTMMQMEAAKDRGQLKPDDPGEIAKDAQETPLQQQFKNLEIKAALVKYSHLTPEKRAEVKDLLIEKGPSIEKAFVTEQPELRRRFKELTGEEPRIKTKNQPGPTSKQWLNILKNPGQPSSPAPQ